MHDAMTLENLRVPTVVICTKPFLNSAHVHARTLGRQGFQPVGIPHPLAGLTGPLVSERAESILDEVVAVLTRGE
jgi:hypothetical protein